VPFLPKFASWCRNVFRQQQVDTDLDEEVRAYAGLLADEKIQNGTPPNLARRQAILEIDGMENVKEQVRDARTGSLFTGWMQDLRYAGRMFRKNPGFTIAAIIALALGIGANTAIFSVVNSVLLRPLPYNDPDKLVVVLHGGNNPVAPANYRDWRDQNHVFESMGAAEYWTPNLSSEDLPEHIWGLKLTSNMFPLLGVQPLIGRTFTSEAEVEGRDHEVVLSYRLWQRRFNGDASLVGKEIKLNGEAYTVVGVMPKTFRFAPFWATKAELWVPLSMSKTAASRGGNSLRVFGRLKPNVSIEQARAEMVNITSRLEQQYPGTNRNVQVLALNEKVVGSIRPALLVLLGAVGCVLLIACANVAHMLLARAAARKKEIAVRIALGAGRMRLIRQFLIESLVLSSAAALAGLLLGIWGVHLIVSMVPARLQYFDAISLDWHVLLFTFGVAMLTGVGFSLAPALHATSPAVGDGLKESERGSTESLGRNRLRNVLVASEFALALVLLVGAGLLVRSFVALGRIDPGFNPHNLLSLAVSVGGTQEADPARRPIFFEEVLRRVQSLPGVESVGAINHIPLAGDLWGRSYFVEGQADLRTGDQQGAAYRVVLPGYFRSMNIALQGRDVSESDNMNAARVVIVNETLAKRFWPAGDAIGKRLTLGDSAQDAQWMTVIGVAHDVRQDDWTSKLEPEIYLPYLQASDYLTSDRFAHEYLTLVVRARNDAGGLVPSIRSAMASLDREVTLSEIQTMEEVVNTSNAQPRFLMTLIGSFAFVALLLAAVGIYAVMSYTVSRRTHEIGIRMALGAKQGDVLRLVVGQGMTVALIGAAVGLAGSLLLVRLLKSLLYGVQPTDPLTFVLVPLLLCGIALLATYIPARRAARVDPMRALRYE
jgi:putative ABC transport system permease protein